MAVQAEMGESASDASIKQVEVDGTAPISDVRNILVILYLVNTRYLSLFITT